LRGEGRVRVKHIISTNTLIIKEEVGIRKIEKLTKIEENNFSE